MDHKKFRKDQIFQATIEFGKGKNDFEIEAFEAGLLAMEEIEAMVETYKVVMKW